MHHFLTLSKFTRTLSMVSLHELRSLQELAVPKIALLGTVHRADADTAQGPYPFDENRPLHTEVTHLAFILPDKRSVLDLSADNGPNLGPIGEQIRCLMGDDRLP